MRHFPTPAFMACSFIRSTVTPRCPKMIVLLSDSRSEGLGNFTVPFMSETAVQGFSLLSVPHCFDALCRADPRLHQGRRHRSYCRLHPFVVRTLFLPPEVYSSIPLVAQLFLPGIPLLHPSGAIGWNLVRACFLIPVALQLICFFAPRRSIQVSN